MCKKKIDSQENENKPVVRVVLYATIGVVLLWGLSFLLFYFIPDSSERGQFGDMFGAANALFSGLAFAGLIFTLILQKQELGLQREELEQTREELKNQRNEFEKENETLRYQRFENLFYNMLNLQQEIVAGLRYDYFDVEEVPMTYGPENRIIHEKREVSRSVSGRDVFRFTFVEARVFLKEKDQFGNQRYVNGFRDFLNNRGYEAYDETRIPTYYDHYFRHLYKIIQFVDSQGFSFEESYRYISLLRGTLSRYELVWIYYNTLNPAFVKFKRLIEKYCLLKSLRVELLARSMETERYYKELGLDFKTLYDNGFSMGDFEFYLTDEKNEEKKYNISAFWKPDELYLAQERLKHWRSFVKKAEKEKSTNN